MRRNDIAARNRRLAVYLVLFIFLVIGFTIFWMSTYNTLGA